MPVPVAQDAEFGPVVGLLVELVSDATANIHLRASRSNT